MQSGVTAVPACRRSTGDHHKVCVWAEGQPKQSYGCGCLSVCLSYDALCCGLACRQLTLNLLCLPHSQKGKRRELGGMHGGRVQMLAGKVQRINHSGTHTRTANSGEAWERL